jgi:hypothetical protein
LWVKRGGGLFLEGGLLSGQYVTGQGDKMCDNPGIIIRSKKEFDIKEFGSSPYSSVKEPMSAFRSYSTKSVDAQSDAEYKQSMMVTGRGPADMISHRDQVLKDTYCCRIINYMCRS